MIDVRLLLQTHGLEKARSLVTDKRERQQLDVAAAMMAEENESLGICHAGFALTGLPHKEINERLWRRDGHRVTLHVETGYTREAKPIGIPYGSKARMILIYLQTQAVRTQSQEVELGKSMRAWMNAMGMLATGGATYKVVSEQARRIAACRLTFFTTVPGGEVRTNGAFVESEFSLAGAINDEQPTLWQESVRLNKAFYNSLIEHPVPVSETALRFIGSKSMAIDIYIWLAYRLHSLSKPTPISWAALYSQFGAGFRQIKHFKPTFFDNLQLALAVYQDAKLNVTDEGIVLYQSRPPVARPSERLGLL